MLAEATEDFPGSPASHRGLRNDVRRHGVLRDEQGVEEDTSHGNEVPAAPRVSVGSAPR